MTITDLIVNFQAALQGLVPCVRRVRVPWKRPEAYDEWDDIATALYQALIVEPLRFSLPDAERGRFTLPAYDMLLPTYVGKNVIEVLPAETGGRMKVFHALGTSEVPFDVVEWRAITATGSPESDRLETTPLKAANFALRLTINGYTDTRIEEIPISPDSH